VVEKMIDYLYKLDYDENSASDTEVKENPPQENSKTTAESNEMVSSSLLHAEVYAMGEKYGIPGLKDLAQRKFEHAVTNGWQDATFCSVVRSVYESTNSNDRGLRDIVTKINRMPKRWHSEITARFSESYRHTSHVHSRPVT
jgi:hypothetical protein